MFNTQPFRLEREMVPLACEWLPPAIGLGPDWSSLTAPMIGKVIPDLLFGRLGSQDVTLLAFTHVEASVLSLVHDKSEFTMDDVLSRIFLPDITATRTFRALERKGALERTPTGAFRVNESLAAMQMEIVAVELKLRRWREACVQAASYLSFADRAYAVLDGNQLKVTEEVISAFRNAGVGLVLQYGCDFRAIIHPSAAGTMTADRVIAAQKLARAVLT